MSSWIEIHLTQIAKEEAQRKQEGVKLKLALDEANAIKRLAESREAQKRKTIREEELHSITQRFKIKNLLEDVEREMMQGSFVKNGQTIEPNHNSFMGFGLIKVSEEREVESGGGTVSSEIPYDFRSSYTEPYSYVSTRRKSKAILAGAIYLAETQEYNLYCLGYGGEKIYNYYHPDFPKGWRREKQSGAGKTFMWDDDFSGYHGNNADQRHWREVSAIPDVQTEEFKITPLHEKRGLMFFDATGDNNEAFKKQLVY